MTIFKAKLVLRKLVSINLALCTIVTFKMMKLTKFIGF
jgi:hypothetical protein